MDMGIEPAYLGQAQRTKLNGASLLYCLTTQRLYPWHHDPLKVLICQTPWDPPIPLLHGFVCFLLQGKANVG